MQMVTISPYYSHLVSSEHYGTTSASTMAHHDMLWLANEPQRTPRTSLITWLVMMGIAFMGYVLP